MKNMIKKPSFLPTARVFIYSDHTSMNVFQIGEIWDFLENHCNEYFFSLIYSHAVDGPLDADII